MIVDSLRIVCLDLCAGIDCGVVPGLDDAARERVDVDSKLSRRRDDHSECGFSGSEPRRIVESIEPERFDEVAFRAPTDLHVDFAFGLDGVNHDDPGRMSGPLVTAGHEYPSAFETLRHLESTMEPPTGAVITADLIPMDLNATFSKQIPGCSLPREREIQPQGQPNDGLLDLLPAKFSTPSLSTLVPPPSFSSVVTAIAARDLASTNLNFCSLQDTPIGVVPGSPQNSTTVSRSGMVFECTEITPGAMNLNLAEVQEEVIAGPRLFQFLDDDGME